jgi:8-oxo-dGTP pyrophosphatase MutT (NUDIX family)
MQRVPFVAILLENTEGEVLLLLRESRSTITCPKHWTLIGGKVGEDETPERAARRALKEETGLKIDLAFWKRYDREHSLFIIDQHIFIGKVKDAHNLLVLSPDMQFFKPSEVARLNIGYGFDALLSEYFLIRER